MKYWSNIFALEVSLNKLNASDTFFPEFNKIIITAKSFLVKQEVVQIYCDNKMQGEKYYALEMGKEKKRYRLYQLLIKKYNNYNNNDLAVISVFFSFAIWPLN